MTDEVVDLRTLIDGYLWQVNDVEKALTTLAADAEELTREVEAHKEESDAARANLDALVSKAQALVVERDSLIRQYSEASFEQDTAKLQGISRRRVALDEERERVDESIRNVREPERTDHARRAAELSLTKESIGERIPKKIYESVVNKTLDGIKEAINGDAERLRKAWNAIKVPALYSSKQLEDLKREKGTSKNLSPAYLQRQEYRRQQRMERFKNVAGNTDAMHSAMSVSHREPEPRTKVTSGERRDGVLTQEDVRAALAKKSA